jgi:hypothetical protein
MARWTSRVAIAGALIQIGYGLLACVYRYPTISDRPFEALWAAANLGMIANIVTWLSIKAATGRLVLAGGLLAIAGLLLVRQGRALRPARPAMGQRLATHGPGGVPAGRRNGRCARDGDLRAPAVAGHGLNTPQRGHLGGGPGQCHRAGIGGDDALARIDEHAFGHGRADVQAEQQVAPCQGLLAGATRALPPRGTA